MPKKRFVIVGGGGYIGYHIGLDLHKKGHQVVLLDLSQPDPEWVLDTRISVLDHADNVDTLSGDSSDIRFISGSLTSLKDLERAFQFAHCVFLCASYGMSGREQMPSEWDKTEEINITGAKNVVAACCTQRVPFLVYTSTFNVVFGGQEVKKGDESLPYFPLHRHVDNYSRTKSIAEQLVLMADGKRHAPRCDDAEVAEGQGHLRTCALRLAGVMGVKEKRHLPRIVASLPFFKFRYGSDKGLVQFVSLSNVVQAHVKASLEIQSKPEVIGGQAYFISDGTPINNFEYFKPLMEKLGYSYPKVILPMWLIWTLAYLCQLSHSLATRCNPKWTFTPFLTPAEVYKTGVTHYFSIAKARRDFGFDPSDPNDLTEVADYFHTKTNTPRGKNELGDKDKEPGNWTLLQYFELVLYSCFTVFVIFGFFGFYE